MIIVDRPYTVLPPPTVGEVGSGKVELPKDEDEDECDPESEEQGGGTSRVTTRARRPGPFE
jgi:hypothetical protein